MRIRLCRRALFLEQQANAFLDLRERLAGDLRRALSALFHLLVEVGAILHKRCEALADGAELLSDSLADGRLEIAVALARELARDVLHRLVRDGGVDGHEVVDAILALAVADLRLAVRDGALEFLQDGFLVVENGDGRLRVRVGLAHLARRILQAHDACTGLREIALGQLEHLAVGVVEARRDVARELEVLRLVRADRHIVRLVEQDVACHERGVGEEAGIDVVRVLRALVLELRHARELAELGAAVHDPAHLRVALVVALHEDEALIRVDAAGEEQRERLARLRAALGRVDVDREGVEVGDEIVAEVLLLQILPALDGAEIVTEREDARRLDAGKDDLFRVFCFFCHDGSSS